MRIGLPALLAAALGCVPAFSGSVYDWGSYDKRMYDLMRNPTALEAYVKALKAQIERNPDGKRIPPGIYAEYGYVLFVTGNRDEARTFFERERARWPESARLMDRMIAQCTASGAPGGGPDPAQGIP